MNNKGVSAVIGIILMVVITVAIALTVYVYVDSLLREPEIERVYISGNVTKIEKIYSGDVDYRITFDYNNTYLIGNADMDWVLGKHYNMTIWRSEYLDKWIIEEYVLTVEELN